MERRASHGEQMTVLSVLLMSLWLPLALDGLHSGVGWGKGVAAALFAAFGTVLLAHNAAWAVGYKVPGALGFHCLLNGVLLVGTVLLASRAHGAVRVVVAVAAVAPAAGFRLIVRAGRKAGGP